MRALAKIRNDVAHMPGPWTQRPAHDRRHSVRLLGKVYSGTMDLWGTLCRPDGEGLKACDENRHDHHGDRLAALLPTDADEEG